MSIILISDLHLDDSHSDIATIFLRFLDQIAQPTNTLYILGDFFEVWIGDDNLTDFNTLIINALRAATNKGLKIYVMHGNRDFLLGKKFLRATGCHLLPDQTIVTIHGVPTLLMHGDTLCTQDIKYLKFRKKVRNWLVQKLFLLKSLKKRRAIAAHYRTQSQSHISTLADNIMDVTQEEVERVMLSHQLLNLIHGHTHRQAVHHFKINSKPATRTVLGAWHENGNAIVFDEQGKQSFVVIK